MNQPILMLAVWCVIIVAIFAVFRLIYGSDKTRKIKLKEPLASIVVYTCVTLLFVCLFMIAEVSQPRFDGQFTQMIMVFGVGIVVLSILLLASTTVYLIRATGIDQLDPTKLVINGPYNLVRHPIYCGIVNLVLGWYLFRHAAYGLLIFPVLRILFYMQAIFEEKEELELKFSDQYLEYKKRVPRILRIPNFILLFILYIAAVIEWLF
jgi:protein-S-isoprenylcysteine O-methyltransferase Ste14